MRSSTIQIRFQRACLAGGLAALLLAFGCARSPETMTVKTSEGTETVAAPTPATLLSMARMYAASGRPVESERLLGQLLAKHPECLPAYNELADLLVRQGRLDQARTVLKAGLAKAPRDPVLLNNAGMCHLLLKQHAPALEFFKQACAANPAELRYRANLALAYGLVGDSKNAQALYRTFLTPQETEQNLAIIGKTRLPEFQAAGGAAAARKGPMLNRPGHPALPLGTP